MLTAAGSRNVNFGELGGEISGFVYQDNNDDGLRAGDNAIAGVIVSVTSGGTVYTAVSDATGFYKITGLPISAAGVTYSITETQPTAYVDGKETSTGTINPGAVNDKINVTLTTCRPNQRREQLR